MVEFLIRRPIATLMSFTAIVLLGLAASFYIPVSLLPDINIPEITIHIRNENASVEVFERAVVTPFRKQLLQVSGLKNIQSKTDGNQALIRLVFDYGVDIDYAFIEVNDKIDGAMSNLPKEIPRPRVIKASASDIPVFFLNISYKKEIQNSESFIRLSEFANDVVKKRIEQLPEVAIADISGMALPEIYIIPHEEIFRGLNITISDLQNAFIENNLNLGSIQIRDGQYQYNLMFNNELKNLDEIGNILIKKEGRIFHLQEIAQIGIRPQERHGLFLNAKKEAINIGIIKQSSAQMNKMKFQVEEVINLFQEEYPDLNFEISQDQTALLNYSINNLKQSLLLGGVLAVLIMFLFVKNAKAPILIASSIPVSLIISILIFYGMGISINIISLSGLILGVGMMIDNSIIVIDTILQRINRGEDIYNGIIQGTKEVIRPLISSVLTTCAVFIPLIFLSGISGAIFYDQAMAVSIGLFVSLIVSITLIPVLFNLFHVGQAKNNSARFAFFDLEKHYSKWFDSAFKYRKFVFSFFFLFVLMGILLFEKLEKRQMPEIEQREVCIKLNWNESISINQSKERLVALIGSFNNIQQSNAYLGAQDFLINKSFDVGNNECILYIKAENAKQIAEIQTQFKEKLTHKFPKAEVSFAPPKNIVQKIFSDSDDANLIVEISNLNGNLLPEQDKIDQYCSSLQNDISVLNIPKTNRYPNINLIINHQKLVLYDIEQNDLLIVLKNAFNQNKIGQIINQNSFIPVVTAKSKQPIGKVLENTFVKNKNGDQIPVSVLLNLDKKDIYQSIVSNENGAFVPIRLDLENNEMKQNIERIQSIANEFPDLNVKLSGTWFETRALIKEMSIVLLISLLLLYFILAAQFESLLQPIIVLVEIPIAASGSFLFLYVFNSSINVMSLIGIVVMSGIVINDSILKIDTINKLKQKGYPTMEAIHEGGKRRIKPIMMTSITTILALTPVLFGMDMGSKLQSALALTIIGGLFIGTLVSLFLVPSLYYFLYKDRF